MYEKWITFSLHHWTDPTEWILRRMKQITTIYNANLFKLYKQYMKWFVALLFVIFTMFTYMLPYGICP